ncbi:MAG: efflux RND transporter periplasmic adaptor subunit [Gammaproteobacteria bacterium]|nr:efflux RND transporter periplasmic adaptor subunit [Gammaproteobacteria bacterium]
MITQRKFALATALLGAALVLAACSGKEAGGRDGGQRSGPGGAGGPPPATVITSKVERRPFGPVIEAVGTALARESVEITSKSANTVTAIRFAEGQRVAAGAILVELDRAQVAAALAEAEANLVEARNQFNRGRDLSVTSALSKAQLDQLETAVKTGESRVAAARARLDDTVIRAPFAGRTGFRKVSRGGLVNPGTIITTLDDSSVIKLEFTVPQSFLNDLAPGLAVEARAEGLGGRVFNGKITTIDSRIDPVTRWRKPRCRNSHSADGMIRGTMSNGISRSVPVSSPYTAKVIPARRNSVSASASFSRIRSGAVAANQSAYGE